LDSKTLNPVATISTPFNFSQPTGVSVANDPLVERIYIADTGNNRVLVIGMPKADPTGPWNTAKAKLINGDVEAPCLNSPPPRFMITGASSTTGPPR